MINAKRVFTVLMAVFLSGIPLPVNASAGEILESRDLRFSVTLPENWEDMSETLSASREDRGLLIRCGDKSRAAFLVFACEKEREETPDLQTFQDLLTKGITENPVFSDVVLSNPLAITLWGTGIRGNMIPFRAVYNSPGSGEFPVACRIYAFRGVDEYYQFFCWTSDKYEAEEGLVFDRIVNSLRILR